ncbi:MAG: ABC-three component system middle component 5 [Kiloniellales bacterium]
MFSLTYTPAYDPYHAVFRYIALLKTTKTHCMAARTLRVADFFVCFPWVIKELRAPRDLSGFTKRRNVILRRYQPSNYDILPDPRIIFERMEPIQITAVSAMLGAKLITREEGGTENTCLQESQISNSLASATDNFVSEHGDLLSFLTENLSQIGVFGGDGIFSRSGLGEHRYDIV